MSLPATAGVMDTQRRSDERTTTFCEQKVAKNLVVSQFENLKIKTAMPRHSSHSYDIAMLSGKHKST
jgi:hypothetical protein